ncbi:MAG: prepilin-type N-terminal cleavage/methylation domain-containing protein [bacterium]|nr:prepilin-type N-terminal cleavage/methylation domain-containing protein [bacterium]
MATKGYTLIEIMVAVGIFTTVIAAPTGFFVSSLKGQQRALASQELIDNVSYSLEYVSKTLRMAKKELNCPSKTDPSTCVCLKNKGYGFNYETIQGGKGIRFINYQDACQEIFWDTSDNQLKEIKDGGAPIALTPRKLQVISFKIGTTTPDIWSQDDDKQARVTLFLEIQAKGPEAFGSQPKIQIQTTVSQRNLDVQY